MGPASGSLEELDSLLALVAKDLRLASLDQDVQRL